MQKLLWGGKIRDFSFLREIMTILRGDFKYYFADFVRKRGGGARVPPKFVTPFLQKKKCKKDKIRKIVFEVAHYCSCF